MQCKNVITFLWFLGDAFTAQLFFCGFSCLEVPVGSRLPSALNRHTNTSVESFTRGATLPFMPAPRSGGRKRHDHVTSLQGWESLSKHERSSGKGWRGECGGPGRRPLQRSKEPLGGCPEGEVRRCPASHLQQDSPFPYPSPSSRRLLGRKPAAACLAPRSSPLSPPP